MNMIATGQWLGEALGRIDSAVLPSLPAMLDSLLDAAALARPGADADIYAADLRSLASELDHLTRQLETAVIRRERPAA